MQALEKKKGEWSLFSRFRLFLRIRGQFERNNETKMRSCFLSNAQICRSFVPSAKAKKKTNSKKERKIDDERRDDEDNDRRSLKSLCIFVCR